MPKLAKRELLHDIFFAGVAIKGIDGILELIAGIFLFFSQSNIISNVVQKIFQKEILEDPSDLLANYFIHAANNITIGTFSFIVLYLIAHGLIKIGLFSALLSKKTWAHIIAGIVLFLFIIYQLARFSITHSIILLFFTLIDMIILVLLQFEYKRVKK